MVNWKFRSILIESEEFVLEGLNIWNFHWHCTDRKVQVRDPFEGQVYYFKEYEIQENNKKTSFVVGEFSNGKMGIFINEDV